MSNAPLVAIATVALASLALAPPPPGPGQLVVWGLPSDPLVTHVPTGAFVSLAAGGAQQTLAIRDNGKLYLNDAVGQVPQFDSNSDDPTVCAAGMGRNHLLAIRPDGGIVAWPEAARAGAPTTGQFIEVTGAAGLYSVALDTNGKIVLWGGSGIPAEDQFKVIGVGPPTGRRFKAIAARGRYTLALAEDGNIFGWGTNGVTPGTDFGVFTSATDPWTRDGSGHFIAPMEPGNPYKAIAAGLDIVVALRTDGRLAAWDTTGLIPDPPVGVFTHIAAGLGFAAAIDEAGHLHAWGDAGHAFVTAAVPDGVYDAVSAATTHVTAIARPAPASLCSANVWLGLKNSDDVGTKFDLLAEVSSNGVLVGSGQLAGVPGGSSGFNNAVLRTIALSLSQPSLLASGDVLSLRLSVRIAQDVPGHRSGTARLWFNDTAANSSVGATRGGTPAHYYLVGNTTPATFALNENTAGSGPMRSVDVFVDRAVGGNPFKPFGTWSIVLR